MILAKVVNFIYLVGFVMFVNTKLGEIYWIIIITIYGHISVVEIFTYFSNFSLSLHEKFQLLILENL